MAAADAGLAALQALLAAENTAVYGYGLAGAQLSGDQLTTATQDWNLHRAARVTVSAMITQRGGTPQPAAAAYTPPFAVTITPHGPADTLASPAIVAAAIVVPAIVAAIVAMVPAVPALVGGGRGGLDAEGEAGHGERRGDGKLEDLHYILLPIGFPLQGA